MIDTSTWTTRVLAILRIVTALLFLQHATMKFLEFPARIAGLPYSLPTIEIVAGIIEAVAGALILVGQFTRVAAFIASGEMAVAYFLVHLHLSFPPTLNQGEPAIFFCFIFLFLAVAGAGSWSLEDIRQIKLEVAERRSS
jgi:putative oxidoreductase